MALASLKDIYNYGDFYKDDIPTNTSASIEVPPRITNRPHVFFGVNFKDEGEATEPTAGTYTIQVQTVNNPGIWQDIPGGSGVDATAALGTLSVAANVKLISVTTENIVGADEVVLIVTANAA